MMEVLWWGETILCRQVVKRCHLDQGQALSIQLPLYTEVNVCFDVKFNFAETFSYSKDSTYQPSKVKIAGALEWAQLVEEEDNKVVIQHLLVVGSESNPMVIKHWRQDWIYQNTNFYY